MTERTSTAIEYEHPVALNVLTSFLKTGRLIDHASSAALICSFIVTLQPVSWVTELGLLSALILAIIEKYFAWRVTLDAELFAVLAAHPQETRTFDNALATVLGRKINPPIRTMQSRWLGAKRLLRNQSISFGLQIAVLILIVVVQSDTLFGG